MYSMFDGVGRPEDAAKRAAELEQPALGLTDHGVVYGLVEHWRACKEAKVKPLLGCEFYVTEDPELKEKPAHMTVLVMNQVGYQNLMRLTTLAYDHFYYKPRVPLSLLEEHSEGLIVLSGCRSGVVHRGLAKGGPDEARARLAWFRDTFGDRFYAEMQPNEWFVQRGGEWLMHAAQDMGLQAVLTTDAHYVLPDDKLVHDFILKVKTGDKGEEDPTYGEGFHLLSRDEAKRLAHKHWVAVADKVVDRWLEATVEIADRCQFDFSRPERAVSGLFPGDTFSQLRSMAEAGMKALRYDVRPAYVERLSTELGVVRDRALAEYFLVVSDITSWAAKEGIQTGPRGSVCGSLLAHVLGIHGIDPIRNKLLFERFLHAEKETLPDIDLDFDARRHHDVLAYVRQRFEGHAYPILTFGRYVAGNLAKDFGEAFGLGPGEQTSLKLALQKFREEFKPRLTEADVLGSPTVEELDGRYPGLAKVVARLYGQVRYLGRHPGGVCFLPDAESSRWVALVKAAKTVTTCYAQHDLEKIGLAKFDFLGLDALGVIAQTVAAARARHGDVDLGSFDTLDDDRTYALIGRGTTTGIFQLEERGAKQIAVELEPETFPELVALVSLNRPGVSDQIKRYIEGKRHGSHHETYGAIVYQEQVMGVLRKLGLSWAEVDSFLKAVKALGSFQIAKESWERQPQREKIKSLLLKKGVSEKRAASFIERLGGYYFNKAHATGYAWITYVMAYLRTHYPLEFWFATLNSEDFLPKLYRLECEAILDDIYLLPPHVNGPVDYAIEGNAVRVGLKTIKGIGEKALETIAAHQPFETPYDLLRMPRKRVSKKVLQALKDTVAAPVRRGPGGKLEWADDKWRAHAVAYNVIRDVRRRLRDEAKKGS